MSTVVADVRNTDVEKLERLFKERKSIRVFRPDPVPQRILDRALEMARWAPSNCNTQPWTVHLVSGATAGTLRQALIDDFIAGRFDPDIPYLMDAYPSEIQGRQVDHIVCQQAAFGIAREDKDARNKLGIGNMGFWGAPTTALLFMPAFGNEREASDVGGFAQSLMLACTALGLGTCPQTSIGMMSGTIKRVLGITDPVKLLFGVAIGYEDAGERVARLEQGRLPYTDFVRSYR